VNDRRPLRERQQAEHRTELRLELKAAAAAEPPVSRRFELAGIREVVKMTRFSDFAMRSRRLFAASDACSTAYT
jgi:hypothetical protein